MESIGRASPREGILDRGRHSGPAHSRRGPVLLCHRAAAHGYGGPSGTRRAGDFGIGDAGRGAERLQQSGGGHSLGGFYPERGPFAHGRGQLRGTARLAPGGAGRSTADTGDYAGGGADVGADEQRGRGGSAVTGGDGHCPAHRARAQPPAHASGVRGASRRPDDADRHATQHSGGSGARGGGPATLFLFRLCAGRRGDSAGGHRLYGFGWAASAAAPRTDACPRRQRQLEQRVPAGSTAVRRTPAGRHASGGAHSGR
jgi:hypothetical protein